jgi:hypothetical protein
VLVELAADAVGGRESNSRNSTEPSILAATILQQQKSNLFYDERKTMVYVDFASSK